MALRKAGKILLLTCAGLLGLVIVLMLAAKLALDRVPGYQAEIKEWVHQRIGYHVAFTHVSPTFRWYGPELYFEKLELRSKDDARVLVKADAALVGLDLLQLIHSGKLLAGRIELEAPALVVTRLGDDRFAIASEIELGGGESSLPSLTLSDLPSGDVAIRRGTLTLDHWNAALPKLVLRDVNLDLRRAGDGITLALGATLPRELGGNLLVDASAQGPGQLDTLSWTALVKTHDLAFPGWRRLVPEYLSRLEAGSGGFEVVARGRGASLQRADLDFAAHDVVTQLTDGLSPVFEQVGGALTVTHSGDRWTLLGRRVRAALAGARDPESAFDVGWRDSESGLLELHASATYLRIEELLPLTGMLPQKDLREQLLELAPTGEWRDTHVDMARPTAGEPWSFTVRAKFQGLGFAPFGRVPGLRGLNGSVDGDSTGGRVELSSSAAVFSWPSQYPEPIDVQKLATTLYWKRTAKELLLATPAVDLKTRDAALHARFAWRSPPTEGDSPLVTLVATVDNGNVAAAHQYLPRGYIAPPAYAWITRAFVAGHLSRADLVLDGPIRHYPFRDGSGTFFARCRLDGLTLDYKDNWPRGENLAGIAEFHNEGMSLQLTSGHAGGLLLDSGSAKFADFKNGELQVQIKTAGDAADAIAFVRATPIDAVADHVFSSVEGHGPLASTVDLFLPFKEFDQRRVQVHVRFDGVALNRVGAPLSATELTGDADTEGGQVANADVRGRVIGGPFQMTARAPRNKPVTRTQLEFHGTLTGEALHEALGLPANIPIGGQSDWHGVLKLFPQPARDHSFHVTASLADLVLDLPEPLAKPAGTALPTSLDIVWPANAPAQLRVALGSVLRGAVALEPDTDGPHFGRATVTFGGANQPPPSDAQQLTTGGKINRLDLAGWLKLYTPDKNAKPASSYLSSARFEVSQLDYLGLSFLDLLVDLTVKGSDWRIGVSGPNVVGRIALPNADTGSPLVLDFDRLHFVDGPGEVDPGKGVADAKGGGPHGIPAIDFHAADMVWGGRDFGEARAVIRKLDDGIALKSLTLISPVFSVEANGEWRGSGVGLARVEGSISSTDVGATLKQLGYAAVLEAKTGKMDFDLNWVGAPTTAALTETTGHVEAAFDKGQVSGIDPGAGRVLGLASLAALPRRLELDFSDLTDKGLAFDTIHGTFDLRGGSAYTDDVLLKGPAAEIGMIGRVGLKNKDYDQTAVVTGSTSSALPLAAFAGGPVIGAAVLVFTQVFKQPLKGLARAYYRITGGWDNPIVERLKNSDAAGATAEVPK